MSFYSLKKTKCKFENICELHKLGKFKKLIVALDMYLLKIT